MDELNFHDYFVMAPLKLVVCNTLNVNPQDFHDYFVMAPLKHMDEYEKKSLLIYFHDYFVMAPLKLDYSAFMGPNIWNFHDYFVMAPLKHQPQAGGAYTNAETSMTILSWPH